MTETIDLIKLITASENTEDTIKILNDNGLLEAYKHGGGLKNYFKEKRAEGIIRNCSIYHDNTLASIIKYANIIAPILCDSAVLGPVGTVIGAVKAPIIAVSQEKLVTKLLNKVVKDAYSKEDSKVFDKNVKEAIKMIKKDRTIASTLEQVIPNQDLIFESDSVQVAKLSVYLLVSAVSIAVSAIPAQIGGLDRVLFDKLSEYITYFNTGVLGTGFLPVIKYIVKDIAKEISKEKAEIQA